MVNLYFQELGINVKVMVNGRQVKAVYANTGRSCNIAFLRWYQKQKIMRAVMREVSCDGIEV